MLQFDQSLCSMYPFVAISGTCVPEFDTVSILFCGFGFLSM